MPGTLEIVDSAHWHSEPGYSSSVANALCNAFQCLKRQAGSIRAHTHVLATIEPWLNVGMSVSQRERLYYLLGSAYGAVGAYVPATAYYGGAIDLATSLHEDGNLALLLSSRGMMHRALGYYGTGSADLQQCLSLLPESQLWRSQADLAFRLRALRQYADYELNQGHLDTVSKILDEAHTIMPLISGQGLEKASFDWLEAHLFRQSRQPERALHVAVSVLDVISDQANPTTRDRFHTFLANIALDMLDTANVSRQSTHSSDCLALAQWHSQKALHLAENAGDEPGAYLARLAKARYDRFANQNTDTLAAIEVVARAGRWLHDEALIAQSLTALGDDLTARGERESALNMYRQTIGLLDGSQVSVLALPALRKLLLAEEWRTDN